MIKVIKRPEYQAGFSRNANWIINYFKGQDVFIIGGGASLIDFDFEKLNDKNTIVINHSYRYCKTDILVFLDAKFLKEIKELGDDINKFPFKIIAGPSAKLKESENITTIQISNHVSKRPDKMFGRASSTLIAINAALIAAAKKIYLLGIDGKFINGIDHFYYKDFKHARASQEIAYRRVLDHFDKYNGYKNIYNCSRESILTVFPKVNIDNVL